MGVDLLTPPAAARLFTAAGCADPYPSYAEIATILRDPRFGHLLPLPASPTDAQQIERRMFIERNPPDHTVLRGLLSSSFTARAVEAYRPGIRSRVADLVDGLAGAGRGDVVHDLAAPLAVNVIADLMAIPASDRDQFRDWSEDLVGPTYGDGTAERRQQAEVSGSAFIDYSRWLIRERRERPGDDVVSRMVAAAAAYPLVEEDDLAASCQLMLFAGHETTVHLIATGMLALMQHRDELTRLRAEPDRARLVVEELLRYDGPVHLTARSALEPVSVGDLSLDAGERITLLLGAGNQDPRRYADPDRFDPDRPDLTCSTR